MKIHSYFQDAFIVSFFGVLTLEISSYRKCIIKTSLKLRENRIIFQTFKVFIWKHFPLRGSRLKREQSFQKLPLVFKRQLLNGRGHFDKRNSVMLCNKSTSSTAIFKHF